MVGPFIKSSRPDVSWYFVGLASTFPNLDPKGRVLKDLYPCDGGEGSQHGCKIVQIPNPGFGTEVKEMPVDGVRDDRSLRNQVMVFQHKGKFHAVDHQCPHASFALSGGTLFEIEDFGITLSTGLTCPEHGWSFDINSGKSDRGHYKLTVWEVEVRKEQTEVWIRRKPRIG